jgi:hypothetical protein
MPNSVSSAKIRARRRAFGPNSSKEAPGTSLHRGSNDARVEMDEMTLHRAACDSGMVPRAALVNWGGNELNELSPLLDTPYGPPGVN